jgi:hypothetical protein
MNSAPDPVVDFYSGGSDDRGRTLDRILGWDDDRLESVHDYIQWVFPTRQPSAVNPYAPLVTDETARAFGRDARLRGRLAEALQRMLRFYGLRSMPDGTIDTDPQRFAERARVWLHPGNHNHLRLTRIIDSLAALGLPDEAVALRRCLVDRVARQHGGVSGTTVAFWERAGS